MVALITGSTACIQLVLDFHPRLQFEDPSGAIALRPFVVIVLALLIALIAVLAAFFIVELSARFFDRDYELWPLYLGPGLLLSPLLILFMRKVASLPGTPERA